MTIYIQEQGLMLKLKLQYFGHLMQKLTHWKRPWCWEGLGAGEGDDRGWDGWMASPTRWTWVWVNSGSCDGQGGLACCDSWGRKELDMTEWLNWLTDLQEHKNSWCHRLRELVTSLSFGFTDKAKNSACTQQKLGKFLFSFQEIKIGRMYENYPTICWLQETHLRSKDKQIEHGKRFHANSNQKRTGVAILVWEKQTLKQQLQKVMRDKTVHITKGSIQQEDRIIRNT